MGWATVYRPLFLRGTSIDPNTVRGEPVEPQSNPKAAATFIIVLRQACPGMLDAGDERKLIESPYISSSSAGGHCQPKMSRKPH